MGQRYRRASPNAKPDAWVWRGGNFGNHIIFELKLTSPLSGAGVPRTSIAATAALGGTAHELITAIDAKYQPARQLGHTVIPLIHDVFGAVHHEARQCIVDTSDRTRGWNMRRRDSSVPWSAPTLKPWTCSNRFQWRCIGRLPSKFSRVRPTSKRGWTVNRSCKLPPCLGTRCCVAFCVRKGS